MKFIIHDNPPYDEIESFADATLFQSQAWLNFVSEAQNARPLVAEIKESDKCVGWFTGLIIKKFGVNILGSPFPGWTTSYMGFNLLPEVSRIGALKSLVEFSKNRLKCSHLEILDRHLTVAAVKEAGYNHRIFTGFEIDLSGEEETIWNSFAPSTRRNIQKAERENLKIEIATDESFAIEYYDQLKEVFANQKLKPTYPFKRVQLLLKHLLPIGRILCLRALKPDGDCIATAIFPADSRRMYFWGGASKAEYRILRPNEAIQWFAMRHWRNKGVSKYDMGGGGEYKRKYGGYRIEIPWVRCSRWPLLETLRTVAQKIVAIKQRF